MPGLGSQSPHPTSGLSFIQQDRGGGRNGPGGQTDVSSQGGKQDHGGLGKQVPHLNSPPRRVHPTFYILFGGLVGREEGRMGGASAGLEGGGNSGGLRAPAAGGAGSQATPVLG